VCLYPVRHIEQSRALHGDRPACGRRSGCRSLAAQRPAEMKSVMAPAMSAMATTSCTMNPAPPKNTAATGVQPTKRMPRSSRIMPKKIFRKVIIIHESSTTAGVRQQVASCSVTRCDGTGRVCRIGVLRREQSVIGQCMQLPGDSLAPHRCAVAGCQHTRFQPGQNSYRLFRARPIPCRVPRWPGDPLPAPPQNP